MEHTYEIRMAVEAAYFLGVSFFAFLIHIKSRMYSTLCLFIGSLAMYASYVDLADLLLGAAFGGPQAMDADDVLVVILAKRIFFLAGMCSFAVGLAAIALVRGGRGKPPSQATSS